jgi:hypothetical protein
MGRVDSSGRVSDRSVIRALGWQPGDRLAISVVSGTVLVSPDPRGVFSMTAKPYVVLSAAVRTQAGIRVGDPVLLAALPQRAVLVAYSPTALDGLLADYHSTVLGDES